MLIRSGDTGGWFRLHSHRSTSPHGLRWGSPLRASGEFLAENLGTTPVVGIGGVGAGLALERPQ